MCNAIVKLSVPSGVPLCNDWHIVDIDECIAPIVKALNSASIHTTGSCCGHGKEHGYILLKDGRTLVILPAPIDKDYITRELQFNQSIKLKPR